MKNYDLITPVGTNDLLFEECLSRRNVEKKISDIFKLKGYHEIVTPGIEFFDVFNLNSNYFPQESMYKLTDSKGRLLVIRPDSTMPIARVVSTRLKDYKLPLRMYYSQNVYRNTPQMRGRSDEIHQMGIELIGSDSRRADLEVITTAIEVMAGCNGNFRFEIGDIGIFRELVAKLDVDTETKEAIRNYTHTKNYPALNALLSEIGENSTTEALKILPKLFGGADVFEKAAAIFKDEKILGILANLRKIYEDLAKLGYNGKITVDLGIASKMEYYTGIVMKGYLEGYGDSVLSGGRYNKLLSEFGYDVPATGFAVNINAVSKLALASQSGLKSSVDAVVYAEDGYEIEGILYAKNLISNEKINAEYSVYDTLDETRNYAESKKIPKIIVFGKEVTIETVEEF